MPKYGNDELFRLIRSLSQTEKAYFKKFAERHVIGGKNNYVMLFDAIDRQEVYDEKKLLREEKYIRQLPTLKNYLFQLVLKALQGYHTESTVAQRVSNLLQQADLLYTKGVYDACEKLVAKGRQLCKEHELFTDHIKFIDHERRLLARNDRLGEDGVLDRLDRDMTEQLALQENIVKYIDLQNRMIETLEKAKKKPPAKALHRMAEHPLLAGEKMALSQRAKIIFCNTRASYHRMINDLEGNYRFVKRCCELQKEVFERTGDVAYYMDVLTNFFIAGHMCGRYEECKKTLEQIEKLPLKTVNDELTVYSQLVNLKLILYNETEEYDEGIRFVEKMKPVFERIKKDTKPYRRIYFALYSFQMLFLGGNLKESLYWMNQLLDTETKQHRPDLYLHALLLNLVLHHELGNYELLPHLLRSFRRFVDGQEQRGPFEKIMESCFRRIVRAPSEAKAAFREADEKLQEAIAAGILSSRQVNADFNYTGWLKNKTGAGKKHG